VQGKILIVRKLRKYSPATIDMHMFLVSAL